MIVVLPLTGYSEWRWCVCVCIASYTKWTKRQKIWKCRQCIYINQESFIFSRKNILFFKEKGAYKSQSDKRKNIGAIDRTKIRIQKVFLFFLKSQRLASYRLYGKKRDSRDRQFCQKHGEENGFKVMNNWKTFPSKRERKKLFHVLSKYKRRYIYISNNKKTRALSLFFFSCRIYISKENKRIP